MPVSLHRFNIVSMLLLTLLIGAASLDSVSGKDVTPPVLSMDSDDSGDLKIATIQAKFPHYAELLSSVQQDGYANIIVGFDIGQPYKIEKKIGSDEGIKAQRKLINEARNDLKKALGTAGVKIKREFTIIPYMALRVDHNALEKLAGLPKVTEIYEDHLLQTSLAESVPLINADDLHNAGIDGSGWTVAIVDSGIDTTHPVFGDRIIYEACYSYNYPYYGFESLCPNGLDVEIGPGAADVKIPACDNGTLCYHGTHVAGIAAGSNGVAPAAGIIAIQVFTRYGSSLTAFSSDLIAALNNIYDLRSSIPNIAAVNLSLGDPSTYYAGTCDSEDPAFAAIANNLTTSSIAIIAASGNEYRTNGISWPACVSSVVSVGATRDNDTMPSWSNIGPNLDLFAPGVNITSAYPNNLSATFDGTSMATPHVTGAWALLRSVNPYAPVDEILTSLKETGVMITAGSYTKPRIDVLAASAVLTTPTLISPSDASITNDNTPIFDWTSPYAATGYEIEIDDNSDFTSPEQSSSPNESEYAASTLADGRYYWRVRSGYGVGVWSSWTEAWSFTIDTTAPSTPTLLSPGEGSTSHNSTPFFDWTTSSDAVDYEIEIDSNADFNSPEISDLSAVSEYTASILADGLYYWHVRAGDAAENWSGWTGAWSFSVQAPVATFADVPIDDPLYQYIEALYQAGYTAGCSTDPLMYCPDTVMDRAMAAVFMLRGQFGIDYNPNPVPSGMLKDTWAPGPWAEKWAEAMVTEGLSAGCSADPLMYCPWVQLNKQEASVFGLRLKYGMDYVPPAASGTLFADMTDPNFWATKWAEQAYLDGLLPSCGEQGGMPLFCPGDLVDRGLGAYLVVAAKDLLGG